MPKPSLLSKTDYEAARKRGEERLTRAPRVVSASYDAANDRIELELQNGAGVAIPRRELGELQAATPAQLKRVRVLGPGTAIAWDVPDVGFTVGVLMEQFYGGKAWSAELGRRGGSKTSERKAASSRANGALGGRPKSQADPAPAEPAHASRTTVSFEDEAPDRGRGHAREHERRKNMEG